MRGQADAAWDTSSTRRRLVLAAGIGLVLLGAVVLLGWLIRSPMLVQVLPGLASMKFNSTLLFIVLGGAVIAAALERPRLAVGLAAACVVFSGAINLQNATGWSLGIDTLFNTPFLVRDGEIPGRISVYSCTAFMLLGAGLLLCVWRRCARFGCAASMIAAGLVQVLTCAGLVGYATGYRLPLSGTTNMALHTALGLLLGSWAIMGRAWPKHDEGRSMRLVALTSTPAVATAMGLAVAAFVLTALPGDGTMVRDAPVLPSVVIIVVAGCVAGAAALAARVGFVRAAALRAANEQLSAEIAQREELETHQRLLLSELDHRVRNTLSQVLSLAQSTAQGAQTLDQFTEVFYERVRALSRAHQVLAARRWDDVDLRGFLTAVLEPFAAGASPQIELKGEPVHVPARAGTSLCMAYYELATNASRHGALSVPTGRVELSWQVTGGDRPRLEITWQERGGPAVLSDRQEGFGLSLIRGMVPHELGGETELEFRPEGLRCVLSFALPRINELSVSGGAGAGRVRRGGAAA